jgi:exopolysaccharide production protein ExoY
MSDTGLQSAIFVGGVATSAKSSYERTIKRALDLFLVLILTPLALPLVLVLTSLVRLDGGCAFFVHNRVGLGGRSFPCLKIRSMVPDAEERLKQVLDHSPEAAALWKRERKLALDPRITPLGRFLRRTSLDELPQLWNVIRGDMSLVGPRPVTEEELELYGPAKWAYLRRTPGITGLWQVSGRNSVSYDERVALDVAYSKNLSFMTDISILLRTASAVIRRTGV